MRESSAAGRSTRLAGPKRIGALTIVMAASVGLVACGGSGTATSKSLSGKATGVVTYWDRSGIALPPAMVKQFNASHKGLKVDLVEVNTTDEPTKLATAIRAGSVPDLVGMDDIEFGTFSSEHAMTNLQSEVNGLPYRSDLNSGQVSSVKYDGIFYGVPEYADLSVLFYNKTLFKAAGLDPASAPASLAAILTDAKAITKRDHGDYGFSFGGDCPGCTAFTMLPSIYATGQDLIRGNPFSHPTATVASSSALRATLTFYRALWADGLEPKADQTQAGTTWGLDFEHGNIGIFPGSYAIAAALQAEHAKFAWGMTTIPGPTGGYSTFDGGADLGIPKGSKNPAGALVFLKWLLQKSQQVQFPKYGYTPVRTDVLTPSFKSKYPLDAIALKGLQHGNLTLGPSANQVYHPLSGGWWTMVSDAVYGGNISGALAKGQSLFTSEIAQAG
jgi:multiple sugar transport system substrate-binding protein